MFRESKILKNLFRKILQRLGIGATATQTFEAQVPRQNKQEEHLDSLRLLAECGNWAELEKEGHELLLNNPQQPEPLELIVYSLQQGGRIETTAVIAAQAAEIYPNSWTLQFLAGVALKGTGRELEACKYLRRAVTIAPGDSQSIRQLIEALAASQSIEFAAAEYISHCHQTGRPVDIFMAPISTVCEWAQKVGISLMEVGEIEEIPFKAPHIFGKPPATETVTALSNKPYVAELKDVRIFSQSILILTSDGTVLSDSGGYPRFGRYVSFAYEAVVLAKQPDKVLIDYSQFTTRKIMAGIFLSGLASNAFGHWLPEFLPKLQFLQQHPEFTDLPIIVDAGMPQSH